MASNLLPRASVTAASSRLGVSRFSCAVQRCRVGFSFTTPALSLDRLRHQTFVTVSDAAAVPEQLEQSGNATSLVDNRLPVTVITGSLASGKTTLVNHILNAKQGLRIAVIQNEAGKVQLDRFLSAAQETGIDEIEMQHSKCLSFSVRSDLIAMVGELLDKRQKKVADFDHIVLETTGSANPAYIIQTCFVGKDINKRIRLEGVVTVVDGKEEVELGASATALETARQIAYADRIILNKIDLIGEEEQENVIRRIKRINGAVQIQKATHGAVDVDYVLCTGGFTLESLEDIVEQGTARLARDANVRFSGRAPRVSTVSLICEGNVAEDKVSDWLQVLLKTQADNVYRMRGKLSIEGKDKTLVFQGIHEIFQFCYDRPWGPNEQRINKIFFTGVGLDEKSLRAGFQNCLLGPNKGAGTVAISA